jgi:hypothetical protein
MVNMMKRTQVQIPDTLFKAAKELAEQKEISLAELVRRGLEYVVAVTPGADRPARDWDLPQPHALGSAEDWDKTGWRERLHTKRLQVAEDATGYGEGE